MSAAQDGPIDLETLGASPEETDARQLAPGFGRGGVPFLLLLLYLGFLAFFTWYTLTYQLPDFLDQGPGRASETPSVSGG